MSKGYRKSGANGFWILVENNRVFSNSHEEKNVAEFGIAWVSNSKGVVRGKWSEERKQEKDISVTDS